MGLNDEAKAVALELALFKQDYERRQSILEKKLDTFVTVDQLKLAMVDNAPDYKKIASEIVGYMGVPTPGEKLGFKGKIITALISGSFLLLVAAIGFFIGKGGHP